MVCLCCGGGPRVADVSSGGTKVQVVPGDDRGPTDILGLVLFAVGWVMYIVVTVAGLSDGNLVKLYTPRDFSGAYCGLETNWNDGPNLLGQKKQSYVMNVSAVTNEIATQMLCTSAMSAFLTGRNSPLTGAQKDTYSCACCLFPCKACTGSLNFGKGGDVKTLGALESIVSNRMREMLSLADGGASFFDPAGFNGDFVSNLWGQATKYLLQVCLTSCGDDYTKAENSTRLYTYKPSADNPLRVAWDALGGTTHPDAGNIPAAIRNDFNFSALPASICPYDAVYCVPFPGVTYSELYTGSAFCTFEMSAAVVNTVGSTAADAFKSLAGTDFASLSPQTFGTYFGDWEESVDSFIIVSLLAFVIGLVFLIVARFFVGICVWTSVILIVLLFLIGGGLVYVRSGQCANAGLFDSGRQLVVAVTVAGTSAVTNAVNGGPAPSEELTGDGSSYVGVQTRSRNGYRCKNWDQAGLEYWPVLKDQFNLKENFCRNPHNSSSIFQAPTIWCFTTDADKRWDLCSPIGVIQPECTQGYAVTSQTSRDLLVAVAVVLWCLGAIWLLIVFCFCDRIRLAVALNKVGAEFLSQTPHVVLVPVLQALSGVLWTLVWAYSVCFLVSQVPDGYVPKGRFQHYSEAYGTADTPGKCTDSWPTGFVYRDEACTLADPRCYRCGPPRYIFDVRFFLSLFMYLWNNAFIIALGQCCIAGAVGIWFFAPRDRKTKVASVTRSVKNCFLYHTGTLAIGALIIAIVQIIRYILMYLERQAQAQKNKVMAIVARVLAYAFWCLERFLRFLTKNAYIQVALKGTNFCTSAMNAWDIVCKNLIRFGVVATLGRVIHYVGVICITGCTVTVGWFILKAMHPDVYPVVPMALYTCVGYLVGKLYMSVFGMSVDTALQCVIAAEEMEHDGSFVPGSLTFILPAKTAKK
mmetsp:Transcript_39396/g.117950  ORF Transcript_39396/g.117950 Transcript_39396/m.117950 type:complete len:920 (-) Transcript_39396:442-3201(-)